MSTKTTPKATAETKPIVASEEKKDAPPIEDNKALEGNNNAADGAPPIEENAPGERVVKSNFARIQLKNFRGSYKDAQFDDDGVCARISQETLTALKTQFPGIEVISAEIID